MNERVYITRSQHGTVNGEPLTGRVYVTGPHFGADIYSSTQDEEKASTFERAEAERLLALGKWWGDDPRIETLA